MTIYAFVVQALPSMEGVPVVLDSIKQNTVEVVNNTLPYRIGNLDTTGVSFWISFFALLFGVFATWYSYLGYKFQRITSDNTDHVSLASQKAEFKDMTRHLYRNLICTIAFAKKFLEGFGEKGFAAYPSEVHVLKLEVLPEDIVHLERYNTKDAIYSKMHEFKLLIRNYATESEVALMHMKNQHISRKVVEQDLATLEFKPLYLIQSMLNVEEKMNAEDKKFRYERLDDLRKRTIFIFFISHILNVKKALRGITRWAPYVYEDYCRDQRWDCSRSFQGLIEQEEEDKIYSVSKHEFLSYVDEVCSPQDRLDIHHFVEGSSEKYTPIWELTAPQTYKEELNKEDWDVYKIISIAISLDVAIEMNKIIMVDF